MINKIKQLELYKNAVSKDVDNKYEDWQYDLDTTAVVELVNELEQLIIPKVVVPKKTFCKHTDKYDNDIRKYVAEIDRWYCSNCDELA